MPEIDRERHTLSWGPWQLSRNSADLVLTNTNGEEVTFVPLANLTGSAATLDCLERVAARVDDEALAHFVRALIDILLPRRRLCPDGIDMRVTTPLAANWAAATYDRLS